MTDERKSPGTPKRSESSDPRPSPRKQNTGSTDLDRGPRTDQKRDRTDGAHQSTGRPRPRPKGRDGDHSDLSKDRPRSNKPGGRPQKNDRKEERAKAQQVNKVRTEFGTRVARRITCSGCGQRDTIDFVPKTGAKVLCRKCAYQRFNIHDPDQSSLSEYDYTCATCEVKFKSNIFFENEDEMQCSNCYRGIETKQDDRTKTATPLKKGVIRVKRKPPE